MSESAGRSDSNNIELVSYKPNEALPVSYIPDESPSPPSYNGK